MANKLVMSDVNSLSSEEFIERFGNVVEMTSLCSAAICMKRPFATFDHLYDALCEFIDDLPTIGKEGILRCHPDLAGRLASMDALTAESKREQAQAGLGNLTKEETDILASCNYNYRHKFGFPFIICARQNKKEAILNGIQRRVRNDPQTELHTGIEEVKKIMLLRLKDLVECGESKL